MGKQLSPRKKLVKELDKLTSRIVVLRDKRCITCGSMEKLGNGHLFTRQAYSTRWDLINCNAQCWGCNYKHEYDFYPYQQAFINKYGEQQYHATYRQFHKPRKFSDKELKEMVEEYAKHPLLQ